MIPNIERNDISGVFSVHDFVWLVLDIVHTCTWYGYLNWKFDL